MSILMFVALALQGDTAGQVEYTTSGSTNSWVVPAYVTSIHAVAVGGSNNTESYIRRSSTTLLSSNSTIGASFGGGDGGVTVPGDSSSGGGGAGGYSGNGGSSGSEPASVTAGSGGGGGGGYYSATLASRQNGGGVYLHGEGASGAAGKSGAQPGNGSNLGEGTPVGAGRKWTNSSNASQPGGNLRYTKVPIAVTPGETLTVGVGAQPSTGGTATMSGGVRIIWGEGRSYPSNAKDA